MTPPEHRALAETLADRVYAATSDPQALAHIAVVHALLATGPADLEPIEGHSSRPMTWETWVVLLLILGTVLGVVALLTR